MRKHGWQLPYHPLQVVAVAVFLALGFAFYVFFVPFVGRKVFQYVVMGLYTPLITCVFFLYIWCAATDPGDPGVFMSKKYLNIVDNGKNIHPKEPKQGVGSASSINDANASTIQEKSHDVGTITTKEIQKNISSHDSSFCMVLFGWCPSAFIGNQCRSHDQSSGQEVSEDGMFYCSLCEVEVFKYSKHCRVCDKCVDGFDHHCRWLNNCIGRKNYSRFFTLMVSALLLLILQWSIGILVLICCFLRRERFSVEIISKLGSSFSLVPFVVVVASCTLLAMVATLPLAQLFFFHVLLIKKGISTYDYIIALREQDQQGTGGQQSPQMSLASSLTGMSSASSFNTFNRGAWCTPPRLFLEDQFDVVPPDTGISVNSSVKRMVVEEPTRKRSTGTVKISPWTLSRLNAEDVSKVAAEARKKSRILQPVVRQEVPLGEGDSSFGSSRGEMIPRPENRRRAANKRGRLMGDLPHEPVAKISTKATNRSDVGAETSTSLAPLQLEARSAFRTSRAMSSTGNLASSPDSSLDSPDLHPCHALEALGSTGLAPAGAQKGIQLSRSTSDGYEASGGEDTDTVPSRTVNRSSNWSSSHFSSGHVEKAAKSKHSSSSGHTNNRKL
ncbi:probable protein S-acyltransferase 22 [Magnolia sinica]|uniref:probable protein S-acyltransferase 22 n=1 Tax=Magnolia sinica TaxID=86752 RepID=UPI0026599E3F|nr:probable protein S-acyltransferase 22 [Magnolia sinica]